MNQALTKKEYYHAMNPKKNKLVWGLWILSMVINLIGIVGGPASILGLIACIVCGFGVKSSFNKWWGMTLAIIGGVQWVLVYVIGGVVPLIEIIVGVYVFQILNNLDKAYAEYLKTGSVPDTTGM